MPCQNIYSECDDHPDYVHTRLISYHLREMPVVSQTVLLTGAGLSASAPGAEAFGKRVSS